MKFYHLITARQWQELQQTDIADNIPYDYQVTTLKYSFINNGNIKRVSFRFSRDLDEMVTYCVKNQDFCKNLYPTLEKLGLYYGNNTYNKDDIKFAAALKEALTSEQAILLEKIVESSSGMLPPQTNFLTLPSQPVARRLTPEETKAYYQSSNHDDDNYIEFTIEGIAQLGQAFTIFNNASHKNIYQGEVDSHGYA